MTLFEKSRYNVVLCELHFTPIHGKTKCSWPTIEGHYLLIDKFDGLTGNVLLEDPEDPDDEEEDPDDEDDDITHISQIQQLTMQYYTEEFNPYTQRPHKLIRNYHNIIRKANYIKPEIVECIKLPTGENIAIIKTMWIKIIQRKWKNVYAARQDVIKSRSCLSSLFTRQLTGYWPRQCLRMPGLKGMLKGLNAK